jgi:hypothetical protein
MQRRTTTQQGCHALCVIAQQYFSATFTSKGFHSLTEKFDVPLKIMVFQFSFSF